MIQIYNSTCRYFGYETWTVILREEHRLRIFQKRLLRKVFRPKIKQVTGKWDLYPSRSMIRAIKSRKMKWAGHVSFMGEKGNPYSVLEGNSEGKIPLRIPRVDGRIIKLDLNEIG
jgi:hypothetical protein